jgi:hypothetical protein
MTLEELNALKPGTQLRWLRLEPASRFRIKTYEQVTLLHMTGTRAVVVPDWQKHGSPEEALACAALKIRCGLSKERAVQPEWLHKWREEVK